MRKIVLTFTITIVCAIVLVSCNSFERKAKKQMRETVEENTENPASIKFAEEKTILSNDSICIIHILLNRENVFGGMMSDYGEYIMVSRLDSDGKREVRESIRFFDTKNELNEKSIGSDYERWISGDFEDTEYDDFWKSRVRKITIENNINEEKAISKIVYYMGCLQCLDKGRKVKTN